MSVKIKGVGKDKAEEVVKVTVFVAVVATMIFLAGQVGGIPDATIHHNLANQTHCYSSCTFMGQ